MTRETTRRIKKKAPKLERGGKIGRITRGIEMATKETTPELEGGIQKIPQEPEKPTTETPHETRKKPKPSANQSVKSVIIVANWDIWRRSVGARVVIRQIRERTAVRVRTG
jgi:hypothetical protein